MLDVNNFSQLKIGLATADSIRDGWFNTGDIVTGADDCADCVWPTATSSAATAAAMSGVVLSFMLQSHHANRPPPTEMESRTFRRVALSASQCAAFMSACRPFDTANGLASRDAPAMARIPDYVKVIDLDSGRRYEVRPEVTGADGKRQQKRKRFKTLKEAVDHYTAIAGDRGRGIHVSPSELTVEEAVDSWLLEIGRASCRERVSSPV